VGRAFLAAALCHAAAAGQGAEPLVAERITEANFALRSVGGMDATGGIDDWALSNGTLCAVVGDPSHETDLTAMGGALIDLAHCGRNDDQFLLYQELLNQTLREPVPVAGIEPLLTQKEATLVARGGRPDLEVTTRYTLDLESPTRLRVATEIERVAEGPALRGFSGAFANVRGLTPFGVNLGGNAPSSGFRHITWMGRGLQGVRQAARRLDLVVGVGAHGLTPGIAYGQRIVAARRVRANGRVDPLQPLVLADALANGIAIFSERFLLGGSRGLGWLELLQAGWMDLDVGDQLVLEQEMWVGDRADVASVTDQLLPNAATVRGHVPGGKVALHVDRLSDGPITQRWVGEDGHFALRLPPGRYLLRVRGEGARRAEREVTIGSEDLSLGELSLAAPARVTLPRGEPMRLVFLGQDGTPDPHFGDDQRGALYQGDSELIPAIPLQRDLHLSGTAHDPREAVLAPGRYRVIATRGPEFELSEAEIVVAEGTTTPLRLAPPTRAFDTPGWVGTDLHTHAAPSLDNGTPPEDRVRSLVADAVEVLVSSEHEQVFDFAPLLERMGLAERLPSLVGTEITSEARTELAPHSIGHANAFPIPVRRGSYRNGAPANEGVRWRDVFAELRALPQRPLVQLNHARFAARPLRPRAFLSHMGPAEAPYDSQRPLTAGSNAVLIEPDPTTGLRDIDFDAIELLNGRHRESYEVLREDWFSFLLQGERMTGTANSDSHFLGRVVAAPRTYVALEEGPFDGSRFVEALRSGRAIGTNGPWLQVELGGAGIGDTYRGGEATLRIRVDAASWVPVQRLRVYLSGQRVADREIQLPAEVELPMTFAEDGFVSVEVFGKADSLYEAVLPEHQPLAFSNPVWIDADGDGAWTPPGLQP
jgi:hypothetical protein